ncbi:TPA: hypothetical protein ACGR8D_000530 [Burkholderia cenocepacia]|jgi:hypothetical protein
MKRLEDMGGGPWDNLLHRRKFGGVADHLDCRFNGVSVPSTVSCK